MQATTTESLTLNLPLGDAIIRGLAFCTSRLPRGLSGIAYRPLLRFARSSTVVEVERWGHVFMLNPSEDIDWVILFFPKLYDYQEFKFLRSILRQGDTFVDVGANVGAYTAYAAGLVGPLGRVISIEANPEVFALLEEMAHRGSLQNIDALGVGIAGEPGEFTLWQQTSGNRGASTLRPMDSDLHRFQKTTRVECVTLSSIVPSPVRLMKLDIEGLELEVLSRYFADVEARPEFVLLEDLANRVRAGSVLSLLKSEGYKPIWSASHNHLLEYVPQLAMSDG